MKIQTVLTFLVPAYLGYPEKETVKQVSVSLQSELLKVKKLFWAKHSRLNY